MVILSAASVELIRRRERRSGGGLRRRVVPEQALLLGPEDYTRGELNKRQYAFEFLGYAGGEVVSGAGKGGAGGGGSMVGVG